MWNKGLPPYPPFTSHQWDYFGLSFKILHDVGKLFIPFSFPTSFPEKGSKADTASSLNMALHLLTD